MYGICLSIDLPADWERLLLKLIESIRQLKDPEQHGRKFENNDQGIFTNKYLAGTISDLYS